MRAQACYMPAGDAGVAMTIRAMRKLIDHGSKDPHVHETAARIIRGVSAFDFSGEARAVFEWVRRNIRFTRDVYGKETLHAAVDVLRLGIGDCDDFTILMCALLQTLGAETRIVTVAGDPQDREFSHVYPEVKINGQWVAVDAARKNPAFGRTPENYSRKRVWAVDSERFSDVRGLAYNPNALPGAYRPIVNPALRRLKATPFLGLGKYGKPGMRGLGDASDVDWSSIANLISAGGTATSNIIRATNTINTTPFGLPSTLTPAQQEAALLAISQPAGSIGGIPTNTLLLGGAMLFAVMMMRR
jgi:hypothetical protein